MISCRKYMGTSLAAGAAFSIVPRHVLGGPGNVTPSEKLNIGGIGVGGMGEGNIGGCAKTENISALCDVDTEYAGKVFENYPNAKRYVDYREMLEKEAGKHVFVQKPHT